MSVHKYVAAAVGVLFGGLFVMSAVMVLFQLAPMPEIPPESPAGKFFAAFGPTGYLTFVKVLELAGGVLVMVPRFRAIGLVILAPIIVNILAFHVFIAGGFTTLAQPMLLAVIAGLLYLLWDGRSKLSALLD
jgi:putative oxidoreductase